MPPIFSFATKNVLFFSTDSLSQLTAIGVSMDRVKGNNMDISSPHVTYYDCLIILKLFIIDIF